MRHVRFCGFGCGRGVFGFCHCGPVARSLPSCAFGALLAARALCPWSSTSLRPTSPLPLCPFAARACPKAKRSESILAFLAKRNAVTTSQLDLLWSSTLGKHEVCTAVCGRSLKCLWVESFRSVLMITRVCFLGMPVAAARIGATTALAPGAVIGW